MSQQQSESKREAAYEECRTLLPTRYTSDPDVIDDPAQTALVKAAWAVYFRAMDAVLERYPYTVEEKQRRSVAALRPGPE